MTMKKDDLKKLAFVFPGQGSQSLGMLRDLAERHAVIQETFQEASQVLRQDLWQLVQEGPEEKLNQTQWTQPALLASGVALWRVWQQKYPTYNPSVMAGHSLGEYTALVCARSLAFDVAVRMVAERGRFMQEAVPEGQGAMAAILGLSDEAVQAACQEAAQNDIVSAANFNAPGQVVIAGDSDAVQRAIVAAKALGAKRVVMLPVSVPSHCALMAPASLRLASILRLQTFASPEVPILHNVDLNVHHESETIQNALIRQLVQPVRWVETIQAMVALGVERVVECGPGRVLSGLIKRIAPGVECITISDCKEEVCL